MNIQHIGFVQVMHLSNVTLLAMNVINWLDVPSKCSLYSIAANKSQHVRALRVVFVVVCAWYKPNCKW